MKFLATDHHSACQHRQDDEEASGGGVVSAVRYLYCVFLGRLWNFAYQIGEQYPGRRLGQKNCKLIAIIAVSAAWQGGEMVALTVGRRTVCSARSLCRFPPAD